MEAEASTPFETTLESGITGLAGTIAVKVIDNDGGTPVASTTANIAESGTSGIYIWNAPAAPAALGQYTIVWSTDGTYDADTVSTEELVVISPSAAPLPAIEPPDDADATEGPCTAWLTGADVAECCPDAVAEVGSFTTLLDGSAATASQMLYELSGRRWVGLCTRSGVRPCHSACGCGWQVLSRGHLVYSGDSWLCEGRTCGCHDLSRVRLSGWVRDVTQVKINGDVVSSSLYRVDEHKWLTRLDGDRWPACSRQDLADTEEGTFSVTYRYGKMPPLAGIDAAKALACRIFTRCTSDTADCEIPQGAVRITRQGITIERAFFRFTRKEGWATGIDAVDDFLNAYNPNGLARRALFIGYGSRERHARPVG